MKLLGEKKVCISVIIPVYNTEQYLIQCIESVLKQSFREYEIILVDDGSGDSSSKICDKYAHNHDNIFAYHKENEGLGPTRNYGVCKAVGEYITFLDSDDWYRPDTLELLYKAAEDNKAEIIFFDFMISDAHTKKISRSYENEQYKNCAVFFEAKMRRCKLPSCCTAMYKREVWNEKRIFFPATPFEDNAVYPLVLLEFEKKAFVSEGLYFYRTNHGKTITTTIKNDLQRVEPLVCLVEELKKRNYFDKFKEEIFCFCYNQLSVSLDIIKNQCEMHLYEQYVEIFNKFLKNYFGERIGFVSELPRKIEVSVIVPVHNSENYLEECLNSLHVQRFKDIEILCIDDNSTDRTRDIISKYISIDSRFVLITDENGSYGHKINIGIERASGEYISILESDDFYTDETLECLYLAIKNNHADYVDSDYFEVRTVGQRYHYCYCSKYRDTNRYDSAIYGNENHNALKSGTSAIWTGLYNRDFLRKNNVRLNESAGASYQDISFRFLIGCAARLSVHLSKGLYFYRCDNEKSSVQDDSKVFEISEEYAYLKNELDKRGWLIGDIIGYYYIWKYTGYYWNCKRLSYAANASFVPLFLDEMERDKAALRVCWEQFRPEICTVINAFRQNPYLVLREAKKAEQEKQVENRRIEQFIKFVQLGKTVIFGCGVFGKKLLSVLAQERDNVICFCDNDIAKWEDSVDGIEIISPEKTRRCWPEAQYIIANKRNAEEIKGQLILLGVNEDKILIYSE